MTHLADVIAGPNASDETRVHARWRLAKFEYEMFWGTTQPFPTFDEWVDQKLAELDAKDKEA